MFRARLRLSQTYPMRGGGLDGPLVPHRDLEKSRLAVGDREFDAPAMLLQKENGCLVVLKAGFGARTLAALRFAGRR